MDILQIFPKSWKIIFLTVEDNIVEDNIVEDNIVEDNIVEDNIIQDNKL